MKKQIAVCPGTFDPVTNGHLDILERAARLYDQVIVAVAGESKKPTTFSLEERMDFLRTSLSQHDNLVIDSLHKLLVDFCQDYDASVVVKGLRAVSDFEYELMMAQMNNRLSPELETVFLMTSPEYAYLSSSIVKEIALFGGSVKGLVPDEVEEKLAELSRRRSS